MALGCWAGSAQPVHATCGSAVQVQLAGGSKPFQSTEKLSFPKRGWTKESRWKQGPNQTIYIACLSGALRISWSASPFGFKNLCKCCNDFNVHIAQLNLWYSWYLWHHLQATHCPHWLLQGPNSPKKNSKPTNFTCQTWTNYSKYIMLHLLYDTCTYMCVKIVTTTNQTSKIIYKRSHLQSHW